MLCGASASASPPSGFMAPPDRFPRKRRPLAWERVQSFFGCATETGRKDGFNQMWFNKIALVGFLEADAEQKTSKNGTSHRVLSLATKRSWKDDQGKYESRTYWRRAVAWGKLPALATTLEEGARVQLVGELRTRKNTATRGSADLFFRSSALPSGSAFARSRRTRF